jgi:hypothetical protein
MTSQKSIYIHIGTHKTGTSAIQDFLALNKKVLKRKGFLFPQQSRRNYVTSQEGSYVVTPANHKYYQKLAYLCSRKQQNVLISSETFSLLENPCGIKHLLDGLEVKIICYLRRQDSVIQSMYNQMVKRSGYYQDISNFQPEYLDYYKLLENWASAFGKDNVIVRVYEKEQFYNHSLIEDFLDILGLPLTDEFRMLKHNPNPRLSPSVLEYMRYINSLLGDHKSTVKIKKSILGFSAKRERDVTTSIYFEHSLLSNEQRQSIMNRYQDSNAFVAQEYLGRQDGQLFMEALKDLKGDHRPQNRLTDDLIAEITQYLCQNKRYKKPLLKAVSQESGTQDAYQKEARKKISNALEIIQ